jgi:hypothetical protein
MTFMVEQLSASAVALAGLESVPHTYTAPTMTEPGAVELEVTKLAGVVHFRVYSVSSGRRSIFGSWLSL